MGAASWTGRSEDPEFNAALRPRSAFKMLLIARSWIPADAVTVTPTIMPLRRQSLRNHLSQFELPGTGGGGAFIQKRVRLSFDS